MIWDGTCRSFFLDNLMALLAKSLLVLLPEFPTDRLPLVDIFLYAFTDDVEERRISSFIAGTFFRPEDHEDR